MVNSPKEAKDIIAFFGTYLALRSLALENAADVYDITPRDEH